MFVQLVAGLALCSIAVATDTQPLPIVDLRYDRHQASFNSVGRFYNFSNIRYAEPPVGELRFRASVPPRGRSRSVNQGQIGRICPQALPAWSLINTEGVPAYLTGKPFNVSEAEAALASAPVTPPPLDPRTSEDCLFLDVVVPQDIFHKANRTGKSTSPTVVWVHGGGFTTGEKTGSGLYNPAGLFNASQAAGSEGFVFVAINYRLGALGWLAGPDLQADGTANAGLYDQQLALRWVQHNIHLFGGDPRKITVLGESAGAASILHHITAFGGLKGPAPFQQAILQSPAFQLVPSSFLQQQTFEKFLSLLNVTSLAKARKLPSSALITANAAQIAQSRTGSFTFGPVVDGLFAPALPGRLLLQGSFDKNLNVMVGYNGQEGLDFTDLAVVNPSALGAYIQNYFPGIQPSVVDYIDKVLYPPVFDGSYGYKDQISRSALIVGDFGFQCNDNYLDRAFKSKTYAYRFNVPPALHGQDVPYTFWNGPSPAVTSKSIALALQTYITSFAATGVPSGAKLPEFPLWGNESHLLDLNIKGISIIKDPTANERCPWWQKALLY